MNIKPLHWLKRRIKPVSWTNLRSTQPISRTFGLDRGTPIDRYYIESFLNQNRSLIQGRVLEIAESTYSRRFGQGVQQFEVLHTQPGRGVTWIGDLTQSASLPEQAIDCFICTQTFPFIYAVEDAVKGAYRVLKPGGYLLATLGGISQISRYDMDRWGDYWRFTTASAERLFGGIFGASQVEVSSYGNVLSSIAFLEGMAVEDLTEKELHVQDPDYQLIITVKAQRPAMGDAQEHHIQGGTHEHG